MWTRPRRTAVLAGLGVGSCVAAALAGPTPGTWDRVSIVSGYLCLMLLCAGLAVGPVRALRAGRGTLNSYLRRDLGIWAGLLGLVHLALATELSMTADYVATYVAGPAASLRASLFSWGSILGFPVGLNLLLLLGLSSDRSLRWLGVRWWKRLQRSSYLAFLMTVAHAFLFQALEGRHPALVAAVALASGAVLVAQWRGMVAIRRRARHGGNGQELREAG